MNHAAALPLPKYHQIYLVLREQLAEGRFAAGLPGELALAGQFGVARITVRKALGRLAAEGLIDRNPGRGTVPRAASPATAPAKTAARAAAGHNGSSRAQLTGLLENIVTMGLATKVKVLECELMPATAAVAEALHLATGALVQKALRVRSTREGPLSLITTHVPAALAQGFGRREPSWPRSPSSSCSKKAACASATPRRPSARGLPMRKRRSSSTSPWARRCWP